MKLKAYYEFIVSSPDESREAVIYKMAEMGATGFIENSTNIIAYFEDSCAINILCGELERFRDVLISSGLDPEFSYDHALLPGKDWNEEWKKNFTPIDVGDNFTVIPSWLKAETKRIPLIIDPGMAFGTGHHETTKRCLMLIEKLSVTNGMGLLDIGTGTGILAIGGSIMGFGQVTGIDTDPLAVDLALRNVSANGITNISIQEGGISSVSCSYDVIAANLISEVLIEIASEISDRLKSGGTAILSGMITGQENDVIEAMKGSGLALQEKIIDGKWVTLVLNVRSPVD